MVNILKWAGWIVALGALLVNFCTTNPPPLPEKTDGENSSGQIISPVD